ncbi:asparagine synthase (glutamine-hydrolyzing) [Candidatus Latescibacterota bacterium]
MLQSAFRERGVGTVRQVCGIAGVVHLSRENPVREDVLEGMVRTLAHRGPDDEGMVVTPGAGLASRRLSIIDVAGGRQPLTDESGHVHLVCNGEIYNHQGLRRELEKHGHAFRTHSDSEVILHLFEERGPECVECLNGMFSFAIWDAVKQVGMVARDRLGIKPLYYAQRPGLLAFASEMKALLAHPDLRAELDLEAVDQYLALRYVPGEATILKGIRKLAPGHLLWVDARQGKVEDRTYWSPSLCSTPNVFDEGAAAEEVTALLRDSVRLRLMSDVPFGAFLSGGLDSSGVVALMSQLMSEPVRTFSIGFSEQADLDERSSARLVSDHCGTEHEEVDCTAAKVELLPKLIWHFDEPFADPIIVPTYQVSELAASRVKVVLTGEGADELFGGYARFAGDERLRRLGRMPAPLLRAMEGGARLLPSAVLRAQAQRALALAQLGEPARYAGWVTAFGEREKDLIYAEKMRSVCRGGALRLYEEVLSEAADLGEGDRMLYCELRIRLPECMLARTDRMTMAVSLEGRTPFLDHRLVERVLQLPFELKVRHGEEKHILKRALAPLLPPAILRRRKQGLAVPFAMWTRHGIEAPIRRILSPARMESRGLLVPERVQELLQSWGPHSARHSQLIWSLLCLELWCRMYLDGEDQVTPDMPLSEVA